MGRTSVGLEPLGAARAAPCVARYPGRPMPQGTRSGTGRPALLLVPTELERRRLHDLGGWPVGLALEAVCGFGPVAAAARTAALLARLSPARVVLVGIAGTFDGARHPVGTACAFSRVALTGVGVGQGAEHSGPPALGFPQWPGSPDAPPLTAEEVLELARGDGPLLLSTCAASASPAEAALRRAAFPDAAGEDMEGFGAGLACALAGVPLAVVRGFSNEVGDRAAERWRIPAALEAARERAVELLEGWR